MEWWCLAHFLNILFIFFSNVPIKKRRLCQYILLQNFCCLCLFRSFICRCVFLHVPFILSAWKTLFSVALFWFFFSICSVRIFCFCLRLWLSHAYIGNHVFFFSFLSICWLANNISDTMARMQMKADSQWTNIYSDGDKYTIRDSRSNLLYVFIIHVFLLIEYFVVVVVVSTRRCCCC